MKNIEEIATYKWSKPQSVSAKKRTKLRVIVDNDPSLNYEIKRWPHNLAFPLIWILTFWVIMKKTFFFFGKIKPNINTLWVDGLSQECRQIKEGSGSWRALDIAYNYQFGKSGFRKKLTDFWLKMLNGQAVRNRLKLVERELEKAIKIIAKNKKREVRLLSIASGSAQAVIDVMSKLREELDIRAVLIDMDSTAIDYSRKLAKEKGLEEKITFIKGSAVNLDKITNGFRPDIVEMIGFLDYRPHKKAISLIKRIYDFLPSGGKLLTSNICPNQEQFFLKWLFDWNMIYRHPKQLEEVIFQAGFSPEDCLFECEPLKIYTLAICQKFA
jgi:hypothetical protein